MQLRRSEHVPVRSVVTFTEYQSRSIQSDLNWNLDDPRLDQLERLNEQSGDSLFSLGRKKIKASKYVGIVRLGDTTLQVLPKIAYSGDFEKPEYSSEYRDAVSSATRNLLVMLSVACDLPLRAQEVAELYAVSGDWLEILTRLFALELHRQFQAGVPHGYVTIEDRLPTIRGRWMVGRQFSRNDRDVTHFDVAYDEFSIDTPLNRIFFLTVDALSRLTRDAQNLRLLLDIRDWLSECKPHPEMLQTDLSNVFFSRLNERLRPVFNLARLFWEQRLVQLSAGASTAFAFVFDMNRLFEDFVAQFLQRHKKLIFPSDWHEAEIVLQSGSERVYLAERYDYGSGIGRPVFRLLPDIMVMSSAGALLLIADTKYKRLSRQVADRGVAEGDVYQMLAYATRWNCKRILMLYPASDPFPTTFTLKANDDDQTSIQVAELNLQQSLQTPDGLIRELRTVFARE